MHKYIILIFTLFTFSISIIAQTYSDGTINSQFRLAVSMYSTGDFDQALVILDKIINENDYNSKTTASEFFKAKIFIEQKNFESAKKVLTGFLEKYPNSSYEDEIRILRVKYNLEDANYYIAFCEAASIIDLSSSIEYKNKAKSIAQDVAFSYLNENQLQRLYDSFTNNEVKAFILLQIGKVLLKSNDVFGAKGALNDLIGRYPNSEEYSEAKQLLDSPLDYSTDSSTKVAIGVMLPLETNSTGEYTSETSAEILEGIKYAVHEFNKTREEKIGLLVRDTKSELPEIEKIISEFASIAAIKAVLGPIYSNEVRATLQESESYNIPVISPTATDDDLTHISENFFQANPSFSIRGSVMAQYLFFVENKRKISILNSIEGYSPSLAANFAAEFEKLGGTIVRKETYKEGSISFDEHIGRIVADSILIEGIYIPLSENSVAPMILAGFVKNNFNIPIYGNQDWLTAKGFETSLSLSNNLTFTTDYFFDYQGDDYYNFNSDFNSTTGRDINRNILYGYDAAKYLLTVIRNIEPTRSNIRSKIMSGLISIGYHNNISIGKNRINKFLNIVRYKNGVFELVDKFRLNE
ncbi:MAG: ABC transporter substrate-binding protein [Ignavibacteriaceae bacterium]|nr:penicillin-binding protein activator [Ignavibacteria bacterium]NNJ54182.1 ABC transporter substrate-binding protein [Ignavibacteriaceae bacterium]